MDASKRTNTTFKSNYEPVREPIDVPFVVYGTGISSIIKGEIQEKRGIISNFVEIIWNLSGIGEVELYGKKYRMQKNDVFFHLPGEDRMRAALSGEWKQRWFCFYGKFAEAIMLSFCYPRLQTSAEPYPEEIFEEIERLISRTDPLSIRRGCALTMEILARMGGQYNQGLHSGKTVQRAIELILTNISDPQLGLPMLSDMLGIAPSTLSRMFKNETKVSPGRYILNRRRSQALSLLRGTDLPVGEIAEQCGFSDRRTFTRFIRRCCGYSPLNFRKRQEVENI